jgi:phosphoribosylformylglycinamidine synthase
MEYEKRVQNAIRQISSEGHAESAHDLSDGGLAVALAECSLSGIGAAIEISSALAPELALFHEGPSRVIVSTAVPEIVEKIARDHNVECIRIGVTIKDRLRIDLNHVTKIDCAVSYLRDAQQNSLERHLSKSHA